MPGTEKDRSASSARDLKAKLVRIDGRGYKAYKDLAGLYDWDDFSLFVDYVQGDPFATPSRIRIRAPQNISRFPRQHIEDPVRNVALCDYIARQAASSIRQNVKGNRGTGKSGLISVQRCGQEILQRTAAVANKEHIEVRLSIGLPAAGRTILGQEAEPMFFQELPLIAKDSLFFESYDLEDLDSHIQLFEDHAFLKEKLQERKIVAFLADGSILPRESGISDRPLASNKAVPLKPPPALRTKMTLPNRGDIVGLAIPEGVTLIVGGGYHGKTTLLRAIERGIYGHVPGDGRELVAARENAVKIRAEDGRRVEKVNIAPFISNLPFTKDTQAFSTDDASGSTSQAANIIEAVELGTSLILMDEDTSATNFMIRDERMQELVAKAKEPITPFIDKARMLFEEMGISSIIVIGGSGDYFDIADTVIMMDEYHPHEVTDQAKTIAAKHAVKRRFEGGETFGDITARRPLRSTLDPDLRGRTRVKGMGLGRIQFGRELIDLSLVEQLVDENQTRAIADILLYARDHVVDDEKTLAHVVETVVAEISRKGLDILSAYPGHPGEYARPRAQEIGAAFNRLRSLKVNQQTGSQEDPDF